MVAFNTKSFSQFNFDDHLFKGSVLMPSAGSVLTYEVNYYGDIYNFIVHIKKFGDDGIEFDYSMNNETNISGSMKIVKDAFESSKTQYNYFSGGPLTLTDQTSVWLSKKVFAELISESGKSTISSDGGSTETEIQNIGAFHDFELYNTTSNTTFNDVSYLYATNEDESEKYWINFSKYNPLILGMDLGWTIWLKQMGKK
jgi:hypothetical protein